MFKGRNGLNWLQVLWYGKIWFTIRWCWYPALMGRRGVIVKWRTHVPKDFKSKITIVD